MMSIIGERMNLRKIIGPCLCFAFSEKWYSLDKFTRMNKAIHKVFLLVLILAGIFVSRLPSLTLTPQLLK